jgi:hypothetical protein
MVSDSQRQNSPDADVHEKQRGNQKPPHSKIKENKNTDK